MNFSQNDLEQINSLGINPEDVKIQLERFVKGFPDLELSNNVSPNKGLNKLSAEELNHYISFYDENGPAKELVKFVPASGAASRMFKTLFNFLEGAINAEDKQVAEFFDKIDDFAFSNELFDLLGDDKDVMIAAKDKKVVELLLLENGLNYGNLPKGLLSFHRYKDGSIRKAVDEHLIEGAQYCSDAKNVVKLHFTVSNEHVELFKNHLSKAVPEFEARFNKTFDISFSVQDKATDTPAVDLYNQPFRKDDGSLLFRPGGHGALLKNLDEIDADVIFIKNIDNVAAEWLVKDTIDYKKALGGILLETQATIFGFCNELKNATGLDADLENRILGFLADKLGFKVSSSYAEMSESEKTAYLFARLNRPTRVCGVVESSNTGGGPFWVKHKDGAESLQLVETAQVNMENAEQVTILQSSEYANITDLFCGVKDFEGNHFDLMKYRDPDTGFIAEKSQGGKSLKAMELPGLWNGAMSDWNTAFVEVPMTTFNPVKTVLDLLKKEHQGVQ